MEKQDDQPVATQDVTEKHNITKEGNKTEQTQYKKNNGKTQQKLWKKKNLAYKAGILDQSIHPTPEIPDNSGQTQDSRRRPREEIRYRTEINKTINRAIREGKAENTIRKFRFQLKQLTRVSDLMNPEDVKRAIARAQPIPIS